MEAIDVIKSFLEELSKYNLNTYSYEYIGELNQFKILEFDEYAIKDVVANSSNAYNQFSKFSAFERTNILLKVADLLEKYKDEFAKVISLEAKKPIKFSNQEVLRSIQTLKLAAFEASRIEGEQINLDVAENGLNREAYTKYESLGIVYAMTPFNFPLNLALHKIGPALAIGNSVILKPSEKTPFSSYLLLKVFLEAGLPKDVIQIVTGDGKKITDELLKYEDIKKLSFTGSPTVGIEIKSKVGLRSLTLELGSTSPVYVSKNNKDINKIASQIVNGAFAYNGQVCISTQKVFVDEEHYDQLLNLLIEKTSKLKYGEVLNEDTDFSDLIDDNSRDRILEWIDEAKQLGAKVEIGGKAINGGVEPTIITNANINSKVCTNEVFGPVLVVEKVNSSNSIIELLNKNKYGLNIGIFTENIKEAMSIAKEVDFGQVLINDIPTLRFDHMPYNGRKLSGYGTEGIKYAIKEMSKLKMVSINYE
ncbi:aldehyde dehydrogenase family protein [Macrococcus capreoli]